MDDEELVRKLTTLMLQRLGYRVTTCSEGGEAIALYQDALYSGDPYAAVILDLKVPRGLSGLEAASGILDCDPQAKLVVSSGYFDSPVIAAYASFGFSAALPKPYTLQEMDAALLSLWQEKEGQVLYHSA